VTDVGWDGARAFGERLRARIAEEVGVTASVGVAPNMSAAKIASDHDKPDGLVVVEPGGVRAFLAPLAVEELHGVGPVTARQLRDLGIETAGDLAAADRTTLTDAFGERGRALHAQANGVDQRPVEPQGKPKSLSSESAFVEATTDPEAKREKVRSLAASVADRARTKGALYKTIGVKVVEPPFEVNTRSRSLPGPVEDAALVESVALDLLAEFEEVRVRKLGVRVSNLEFGDREQANLGNYADSEGTTETADTETRLGQRGQTTFGDFDDSG
jgi:DNA polymerase IV (DinB-like DNA polymerase)